MKEIKTISAKKYLDKNIGEYTFPFQVLDDTPGGSNLGRIEICMELFKGRKQKGSYYIEKIWLWFKQTRDKKYYGKVFEIPCFAESVGGDYLSSNSYFNHVWRIGFCVMHKVPLFEAYPKNHHSELVIAPFSSIMVDIDFR